VGLQALFVKLDDYDNYFFTFAFITLSVGLCVLLMDNSVEKARQQLTPSPRRRDNRLEDWNIQKIVSFNNCFSPSDDIFKTNNQLTNLPILPY
jgi:hypothetical protein